MDNNKEGGPAFPCEGGDMSGLVAHSGMTLRDYFAGQALTGILSGICSGQQIGSPGSVIKIDESVISTAYVSADLMLAARGK